MKEFKKDEFDFLIGRTESEAFELVQEHKLCPRVVSRTGSAICVTRDVHLGRINLRVENNLVVGWHRG